MRDDRVKYYSTTDLSCTHNLLSIEEILNKFSEEFSYEEINQIIEFYNIKCFFDNEVYPLYWAEELKNHYIKKVRLFSKHIGKFFSKINESNIKEILGDIECNYMDDFWVLFGEYKVYNRISRGFF